jgi:hypothetical protein
MTINENQLKITGRSNIMSGLTIGKSYDLTIGDCECRKSEEIPNDNETLNKIFTLRLSEMSEVSIISEKEIIKSKPKVKTQSQTLRWKIEQRWQDTGSDLEKEDFYIKEMSRIISEY